MGNVNHQSKGALPLVASTTANGDAAAPRSSLIWRLLWLTVAFCIAYLLYPEREVTSPLLKVSADPNFDWFSLDPSDDINWTPCYEEYQCARLILPLDYLSPRGYGPNVTIAMQVLPATDKQNYKGTILINPGGPGGSGTDILRRRGKDISRIIGGSFDILGFDPRGTGASTPSAQCFDSESQYQIWSLQDGDTVLSLNDSSVPLARARESVVGQLCEKAIGGTGKEEANGTAEEWGPGRFMSTASVATDMLEIIERLGEESLKYWGFSYGSVLGQYFSAMYPDKVGRVVIDGVFDAYNYRATLWNSNLADTDAGEIKARVDTIMASVQSEPVAVPSASKGPLVITRKILHQYAFQAAYKPTTNFAPLADILVAAESNNQTTLAGMAERLGQSFECNCEQASPQWLKTTEAFYTIACGDGEQIAYTPEGYREWFTDLYSKSSFGAPIWGLEYLRCSEWSIRPKWRYTGPLAAENTSHPVLILSPTYDTVCPLSDARAVHARYGGSGLLIQNSYGHCSIAAPSVCTAKHLRAYFENGTLPEDGTMCEVDELPFVGVVEDRVNAMSVEDRGLLEALRGLAKEVPMFGGF
ncbi:alpha/beta-hydrolase [Laetiporus sulphureus 93-53]|uniref:Alpha/beta-hydrolase n=1 Tax=Laetiporus sulphureus 93-53 TaxID=1314785 RepID=A0A165G576_9APHY|nr:alpha/beta-hydrolase [Laetiporus sulphureus 93-53]KZT09845.1 alpha/beta-hydrolase [Laetiporus sulphureus 93-53]